MALISLKTVSETTGALFSLFQKEVKKLSEPEFRSLFERVRYGFLLDVSTRDEFDELHIQGAYHCDVLSSDFATKILKINKTRPFFIYSHDLGRTETAMHILDEMGFRRIYALYDSLKSWKGNFARNY